MSINARVKHKRDTASNWASKNPVLLEGEIIIVDDGGTMRLKMGDGSTAYSKLPFYDAPATAHIANKSNPHGVTKAQLGLGDVDNTSDAAKPVSTAQQIAIEDAKKAGTDAQSDIDSHTANKSNPHGVTKSQVGLGNVDNTADANKSVKYATTAGSLTNLTATVTELNILDGVTATTTELNYVDGVTSNIQTQLNGKLSTSGTAAKATADAKGNNIENTYATKSELTTHTGNTSNPHSVTKAQVGLGNVDNTADANKSVKYATSAGTLTNLTATVSELNILDGVTATAAEINKLDGLTATTAELNYVDGVTSAIQTQLNAKLDATAQAADSAKLGGTAASSYAKLASPTFTGTPKAPTAAAGTNTTQVATTAFVTTAISGKANASDLATVATSGAYSDLSGTPTSLPANGGNADTVGGFTVGVDVPANAKFTDTTYTAMTADEATTGTATTARSITAKVLHDKIEAMVSASSASIPLKSYT